MSEIQNTTVTKPVSGVFLLLAQSARAFSAFLNNLLN